MKAYRSSFPTMALLAMGGARTGRGVERLEAADFCADLEAFLVARRQGSVFTAGDDWSSTLAVCWAVSAMMEEPRTEKNGR